jgi:AraC family transcriptional regulator
MQGYIERIQQTIDYIETNLDNDITLDKLASLAYCSKFHYHRTFQAMVGETVMEYVRKRRVTFAVNEILNTNKKLIDIAYNSGFGSQVDFSRTFKRIYGITPMECRKKVRSVELYEKVNLIGRSFSKQNTTLLQGPMIIEKEGFNVVGIPLKASFEDNLSKDLANELWRNFTKIRTMGAIKGVINRYISYGISFQGSYNKYFNYLACVEVKDLEHIPEGMTGRTIPACKYAVFNFKGVKDGSADISEFYKALDYIYGQWLPTSEYELASSNDLIEVISVNPWSLRDITMDIYLPIKDMSINGL